MRLQQLNQLHDYYWILNRRWEAEWNKSNRYKLSIAQAIALEILATKGRLKSSELANALSITTGGVTGITDKLEQEGFIQRIRDEGDRRVIFLNITDFGVNAYKEVRLERIKKMEKMLAALDDSDLEQLLLILKNNLLDQ